MGLAGNSGCILYTPHPRGPPAGPMELQASRPFSCPWSGRGLRLARSAGRGRTLAVRAGPCDARASQEPARDRRGPPRPQGGRVLALARCGPLRPLDPLPGPSWRLLARSSCQAAREPRALGRAQAFRQALGRSSDLLRRVRIRGGLRGEESKKDILRLRARAREGCFLSRGQSLARSEKGLE